MFFSSSCFQFLTIFFFVGISVLFSVSDPAEFTRENGFLESFQLFFLVIGFILAALGTTKHQKPVYRYILSGFALLIAAFFIREADLRGGGAPVWIISLTHSPGSVILTITMFVPYLLYSLRNIGFSLQSCLSFAGSIHFIRSVTAGLFLVAGGLFDRGLIKTANFQYYEEFLELCAYYILAYAMFKLLPGQIDRDNRLYRNTKRINL